MDCVVHAARAARKHRRLCVGCLRLLSRFFQHFVLSLHFSKSTYTLGIAIGRVTLPVLNLLVGERRIVLFYILLACGVQAVSWAVNSFLAVSPVVWRVLKGASSLVLHSSRPADCCRNGPRRVHYFDLLHCSHPHCVQIVTSSNAHKRHGRHLQRWTKRKRHFSVRYW